MNYSRISRLISFVLWHKPEDSFQERSLPDKRSADEVFV